MMDPQGGLRRHRFGFGGRRKNIPSADSGDSDVPDERGKPNRGDRRVGFAVGDPTIFRNVKKKRSPTRDRTGHRLRTIETLNDPSDAGSTNSSLMKKVGIMFKSSKSDDSDDGSKWSSGKNGGNNDFSHSYPGLAPQRGLRHAPSGGVLANARSMPPQLSSDLPPLTFSRGPMVHGAAERARYSVYETGGGFAGSTRPVKRQFRVRPYHCFDEPVQMTEEEIYKDSLQPSKNYEFLSTYIKPPSKVNRGLKVSETTEKSWGTPEHDGRLGSFRIELLGCISLARTKPDICVYFVCADMAFCSDVIASYRSPMWPCASRRAAVFPINHAYAQVYIGVFDCKSRKNKENDSFCGRAVIDISALRPDTEYDVTFPLRHSTFVYDRRPRGVVRVRFALHWFNERAAITSYFKNPESIVRSSPLIQGQPTIPCADPKTFRNVAVTCHGIDLPGKYSRSAFRATSREFNLYQMNLRHGAKMLLLDTVLYERPVVSFYVFFGGMHCVISSSMSLVPPYFIGFLLIQLILNHQYYIVANGYNLGYKPLTLWEIGKALIFRADRDSPCLEPILITKRTKERKSADKAPKTDGKCVEEELIEYDHREFPFSEGETYPNFSVEAALAPRSNSKTKQVSASRLHGRLSVYYSAVPPNLADVTAENEDEEDNTSDFSEGDDETVMGDSMMGDSFLYDLDFEGQYEDEELYGTSPMARQEEIQNPFVERNSKQKRVTVKTGPPQDADVRGKKIPPQVHLKRVEARLHKASRGLSVELVHPPPLYDQLEKADSEINPGSSAEKKQVMDDFDKLLGLNERSANPINRIASSFLGPLMRIIRIGIYIVRMAFYLSTWKDPYLTFWFFIALCVLGIISIIFPWRTFLGILTIALVGPQNLFVKVYLAKKALKEKEMNVADQALSLEKTGEADDGSLKDKDEKAAGDDTSRPLASDTKRLHMSKQQNKRMGFTFWQRKYGIRGAKDDENDGTEMKGDRPIFCSTNYVVGTTRKLQPRSVAVPYSRFKKNRFFDWPPDPTVSRATPLIPWESDSRPQSESPRSNESSTGMIVAWKRQQRAEVRRRIAASNRNQKYAAEN